MGFTAKQIRQLQRPLDKRDLRTRIYNGRELTYIEGWHAIAEANRIFGFDKWDRETIETRCIVGREVRSHYMAIYVAKVRITVRANGEIVVREGQGTGEARTTSAAEAHDTALKSAETDATRRALATFGRPFGISLYVTPRTMKAFNQAKNIASLSPTPTAAAFSPSARQDTPPQSMGHLTSSAEASPVPGQHTTNNSPMKVDKSVLTLAEPRRRRDRAHLAHVASQPCLVCARHPSDAHHLRFMQPRALGLKVSDEFTVPLCRIHHRQLHRSGNEVAWWNDLEIDAERIARDLWDESQRLASHQRSIQSQVA